MSLAAGLAAYDEITDQGELTVGAATVQLTASTSASSAIWFGAPTADHTVAAVNDGNLLIGKESGGNESGGITLESSDAKGFLLTVKNPSNVYVTGLNAGDALEFVIFG